MDEAIFLVHTNVNFHSVLLLIPFLGLVQFWIPLTLIVLLGAGCRDQDGINDRACFMAMLLHLTTSKICLPSSFFLAGL